MTTIQYVLIAFLGLASLCIVSLLILALDRHNKKQAMKRDKLAAAKYAQRLVQIIEESKGIINKSKKLDTIVRRFDVILNNADILVKLAEKYNYPNITNPPPQACKEFYLKTREEKIRDFLIEQIDVEIEKAQTITRKASKITLLDKALLLIVDGKRIFREEDKVKELEIKEKEVKDLIHQIEGDES